MNIAIDITPIDPNLDSAHKVRGVGMYMAQLVDGLKKMDGANNYEFFSKGQVPINANVVHYPYFDLFFNHIKFPKHKMTVVTVHDLTPLVFSKEFPIGMKGRFRWELNKRLLRKANAIITDSQSSKRDIHTKVGIPNEKIQVIYLSANEIFRPMQDPRSKIQDLRSKYGLPEKFFLYVGDATWNKNLPRVVEAFKKARIPLVLVGKALKETHVDTTNPWNNDLVFVQKFIDRDPLFRALGFVPTEALVALYNMAEALVMPSLYEGFGLPVLEAMQSGCPVITSKEGSLPEVAGDAALYVDVLRVDSLVDIVKQVYGNDQLRQQLIQKGLEQAKKFTLEKMIRETEEVYEKVYKVTSS